MKGTWIYVCVYLCVCMFYVGFRDEWRMDWWATTLKQSTTISSSTLQLLQETLPGSIVNFVQPADLNLAGGTGVL